MSLDGINRDKYHQPSGEVMYVYYFMYETYRYKVEIISLCSVQWAVSPGNPHESIYSGIEVQC